MNEVPASNESYLALGRIGTETPEDHAALTSVTNTWLTLLNRSKWARSIQHFENASYLLGNHLTRFFFDGSGLGVHQFGLHDKSQFDNLVAKTSDNRLIRPTETMVSMLVQTRPTGRSVPNSSSPEDEDAAALAQIVLDTTWEKPLNMPAKLYEGGMTAAICGTVAWEVEYGETDIPVIVPGPVEVVETDEKDFDGEPMTELRSGPESVEYRKDIIARVWTPFHLTVDPAATSPDDLSWIARTSFEDIDWIREAYDKDDEGYFPDQLPGIASENQSQHVLYWWSRIQDILEVPHTYQYGGGFTSSALMGWGGSAPNQTTFTVIDVKPTLEHPMGRTLVLAGGKLIYAGPARSWTEQYPWRWHPYAFWSWMRVPGRFWGVPLLSMIVPLQKRINAVDALVQINREFMSIGQWKLPRHSKIPDGMMSGIPAQHVRYTAIQGLEGPEKVDHRPLPNELLVEREESIKAIDLIAAAGIIDQLQISRSAARAGVMLNFLRQERLRSKSPTLQEFERAMETVCQNVLIEYQYNLRTDDPALTARLRAAARDHSSLAIKTFVGADLRDHHTVKLDIASALLKTPEAKQAQAMEVLQFLGPNTTAEERRGIFQVLELDDFLANEENASVDRARRMVSRIINAGENRDPDSPKPSDFAFTMPGENTKAVLGVIQVAILDDKYNDYTPEVKKILQVLRDQYEQLEAQRVERELQMRILLARAVGGGSGGDVASEPEPAA